MNGVTGRMGLNQHLRRSILEIIVQGGVATPDGNRIMPRPMLVGRNAKKLEALARENGDLPWTTDLDKALADPQYTVYFDAQTTDRRAECVRKAIAAGKDIYCEKPTADNLAEALGLYELAKKAKVRHGVVQDKLWVPGLMKLKTLRDLGFFCKILSVRGEFGYWVFEGDTIPAQRPSWNYRKADGGGIILDMLCHWRYVLDNLFGQVKSVSCVGATHVAERWDENGNRYRATADDAAYATFRLAGGVIAQFNSSWCVRVRRDDLVIFQVDGTKGSAVAGLTRCFTQSLAETPRPVWNPDVRQTHDFGADWKEVPDDKAYDNAFKAEWELFIRHVCEGEPFRWNLLEGAKGLQLVECALKSWRSRRWVDVPGLKL